MDTDVKKPDEEITKIIMFLADRNLFNEGILAINKQYIGNTVSLNIDDPKRT